MSDLTINFSQLSPLLPIYAKRNLVPFIAGEPGIGKSATVKNLANQFKTKVFVLSVNQLGTREDLTGARSIKDPKTETYRQVFFPHAIIQEAIDYAKDHPKETPFLFLDEINRTSPDVTSAILALITERRIGTTELPDNIRIIAAGNDHGNVNNLDDASITRMAIFHVEPDVEDFIQAQPELNYYIKSVLRKHPNLLVNKEQDTGLADNDNDPDDMDDDSLAAQLDALDTTSGMKQMTVPRTLTYTSEFLNEIGLNGTSLPKDLNKYYDPIEPENSPLYAGLRAQLGDTEACHDIFTVLVDDIDRLTSKQNSQDQTNVAQDLPQYDPQIIEDLANISSVDEFNEWIKKTQDKNPLYNDTFFTILLPENLQQLPSDQMAIQYYNSIANGKYDQKFKAHFLTALQNGIVPKNVMDYIQNDQTDLSKTLTPVINVLFN